MGTTLDAAEAVAGASLSPVVCLVLHHVIAVELLRGVADANPEFGRSARTVERNGEHRFSGTCDCRFAHVVFAEGFKADVDNSRSGHRRANANRGGPRGPHLAT